MMNSILRRLPRRKETSSCASSSSGSSSSSASSVGLQTPEVSALQDTALIRDSAETVMDEDETLHDPEEWTTAKGKEPIRRRPGMLIELPAPPPLELPTAMLSDTSVTPTRSTHLSRSASRTSTSSDATSKPGSGSDSTPRLGSAPTDQRMHCDDHDPQQTILFESMGPQVEASGRVKNSEAGPLPTWLKHLASKPKPAWRGLERHRLQDRPPSPPGRAELLQLAQVALIKKQQSAAIRYLRAAVELNDTVAASALGRLLLRDADALSTASNSEGRLARGVDAADIFIRGIALELEKPQYAVAHDILTPDGPLLASNPTSPAHSRRSSASSDSEFDETSPRYFSLESLQDLIVGLTTCYRYGFLSYLDSQSSSRNSSAALALAQRGEHLARQTLLHPAVTTSEIASLIVSAPTPPHSPPLPLTPSMVFALSTPPRQLASGVASAEPRPKPPTRALTDPAYSRQTHLKAEVKQSLTIRANALYILALQAWPHHKDAAERYWRAAVAVADSVGGVIGTKEGDEIIFKARRRLQTESDESRKNVKLAGRPVDKPTEDMAIRRRGSGDALIEMARSQGAMGQHSFTVDDTVASRIKSLGYGVAADSYFPGPAPASENFSRPLRQLITQKSLQTDYPSPPETPDNSPPSDSSTGPPPAPLLRRVTSTADFQPPRLLRRVTSSTSISTVPPNFGRPRTVGGSTWEGEVQTTTRAATVLAHSHTTRIVINPLSSASTVTNAPAHWTTGLRQRLSTLKTGVPFHNLFKRQAKPTSATSLLRQVIAKDDESLTQVVIDWGEDPDHLEELEVSDHDESPERTRVPFGQTFSLARPHVQSMSSPPSLRSVARDKASGRPLVKQRSFVDVTTPWPIKSSVDRAVPQIVCQPPTPQRDHLLPPRPQPRKRKGRKSRRSSCGNSGSSSDSQDEPAPANPSAVVDPWMSPKTQASALPPLDPFLAALERDSRMSEAVLL
ncbi:hypothetical protein OIV83_002104 [Microbotryomycetes sp. JL201]|nr:hypothetical protein OIV83_002104 [Microbotryomycetes sp. JL201]